MTPYVSVTKRDKQLSPEALFSYVEVVVVVYCVKDVGTVSLKRAVYVVLSELTYVCMARVELFDRSSLSRISLS